MALNPRVHSAADMVRVEKADNTLWRLLPWTLFHLLSTFSEAKGCLISHQALEISNYFIVIEPVLYVVCQGDKQMVMKRTFSLLIMLGWQIFTLCVGTAPLLNFATFHSY